MTVVAPLRASSRLLDLLLPLLLFLCIGRLWLMPMWSSFWVDEMATVFVVQHSPDHPSLRVAPQVPESIYYLLPRVSAAVFGFSEAVYRLPSVLAMAGALLLIGRLAARLIHPQAAWMAVFACLSLRGFDYQAADARPYALGTLVACASLWLVLRWLDSGNWLHGLAFFVLATLLWSVQLIFWPFYLVFGIYVPVRLARRETPLRWIDAAAIFAVLGSALVPRALKALALYREAGAHVIVALPTVRDLALSFKLGLVAACGVGAWLLSRVSRSSPNPAPVPRSSVILILAWWLCQPFCLFAFSWLTGNSVFLARYLWLALPGGALAAVLLMSRWLAPAYWKPAAAVVGLAALLLNGQWSKAWPRHHNSDWRAAANTIRDLHLDAETPIICPSPFIEAKPPAWYPDYPLPGFLYSHLAVYPVPGRTYLFPFEDSQEAEAAARQLAIQISPVSKRLVLYGGQGQVDFWTDWFAAQPELKDWGRTRLRTFGDVEIVLFHKPR